MSNDNNGCGCSTIILIVIAIALITMCNRLAQPELLEPENKYIIIYPNGDTIKSN